MLGGVVVWVMLARGMFGWELARYRRAAGPASRTPCNWWSAPSPRPRPVRIQAHGHASRAQPLSLLRIAPSRARFQEAYLAIQMERSFTKQQISKVYGNQSHLGSGMYGFEAASQYFFRSMPGSHAHRGGASCRAARRTPFSPILDPERAPNRRNLVLSEMEPTKPSRTRGRAGPRGAAWPAVAHGRRRAPSFQEECGAELDKHFGSEKCTRLGTASTPRSISTCSRSQSRHRQGRGRL